MRKIISLFFCLLTAATFLSGCPAWPGTRPAEPPPVQSDNLRETVLYLPDQSWQYIVPVRFPIPWEDGIARAALDLMTDGRLPPALSAAGLAPLLPAGTEILGLTIRDGLAKVDFNRAFLRYLPAHERQLLKALIFTLTEFPTVNRVEIMVEGEKLPASPAAAPGAPLDREGGLNLEGARGNQDKRDRVTLYFLHNTGPRDFFVPVSRQIPPPAERINAVVRELLRGPSEGSVLSTAIPPGLTLQRTELSGGRLRLHLSGEQPPGGQPEADRLRDQLALTLTELSGISEIEVLINGKAPRFPSGVSFPPSFGRPPAWNEIMFSR